MNILYSSDDNFVRYAATSIYSLLKENDSAKNIRIYYINNNICAENINLLVRTVNRFKREIIFINMDELIQGFEKSDDYSISSYARLFASLIPNLDKVIYIDCDTIIIGKLDGLWELDLGSNLIAGVKDTVSLQHALSLGLYKQHNYINAGVLVMNLSLMRKVNFPQKVISLVRANNGKIPHEDQGIINILAVNRIHVLDPKYNLMPQFFMYNSRQIVRLYKLTNFYPQYIIDSSKNTPVIIHFISKFYGRPWEVNCSHPYKNHFIELYQQIENVLIFKTKKHNVSYKLRKYIFFHFPFFIHYIFEKILDIRRNCIIKRNHKIINDV